MRRGLWWTWLSVHFAVGIAGLGDARAEDGAADGTTAHDAVVVVLDASGSMSERMGGSFESRMDAAKDALERVLQGLPSSTHVGVVVFSGEYKGESDWVVPLGPVDMPAVVRRLAPIRPGGGTPLGAYMKTGADRLLQERQEQFGYGSYRLLVVTDGQAGDLSELKRHTPDVLSRGITLDVIGVGMSQDHMLASMANSYRRANDPAALQKAVSAVFAEIGGNDDVGGAQPAEDAFQLLAGIPPELGQAMITALASAGNDPIGTKPLADLSADTGSPSAEPPAHGSTAGSGAPGTGPGCGCNGGMPWLGSAAVVALLRLRRRRGWVV